MGFEFNEKSYISQFWVAADYNDNNFLMFLHKGEEKWIVDYRFRYVKDDKIWNSSDEKSFYRFGAPLTYSEDEMLEKLNQMFELISCRYQRAFSQQVRGGFDKCMEMMKRYPEIFHTKEMSVEEFEKEKQNGETKRQ